MINYDLTDIKNSDEICWEYSPSSDELDFEDGWTETDAGILIRMNPVTMGLIASAEEIRMSSLCQGNVLEWVYRLNALFDAGESVLSVDTKEGPVPIRFRNHDLKEHVGLKVSVHNWSKEKFDAYVRQLRMHRILACDDFEI
tara:strand:- start:35 stop:460 length:426 start_codon:yes stop_codon:yes gene_type:complete